MVPKVAVSTLSIFRWMALAAILTLFSAPAEARDGADAGAYIREFGNRAIALLADDSLAADRRTSEFRRLMASAFDTETMGRAALGRHWQRATDRERSEYGRLFADFVIATYARRLGTYSGERLVVGAVRDDGAAGTVVSSRILRGGKPPIRVDWRLRHGAAGWRVVDVVIERLSTVITRRAEFDSVIRRHGGRIAGLIETLRAKTANLTASISSGTAIQRP